jgi:hypothetical protein
MIKSNITANSKGSVGKMILTLFSKSLKLIDSGVKKTIRRSNLSREKIKRRIIKSTAGSKANQ